MVAPGEALLSTITAAGFALVTDDWPDEASRHQVMRRYLGTEEQLAIEQRRPRAQQQSLVGRIAAKDAVRHHWRKNGGTDIEPGEIAIVNNEFGQPRLTGKWARGLRISIAHTMTAEATIGVAIVSDEVDVGIDIEPIDIRGPRFETLTLTDDEQELAPVPGDDRDTWLTRLWAAKEAFAKSTGRGLGGRPKDFRVSETDGTRLLVNGRWILTDRYRAPDLSHHIVAWTLR